METDTAHEGGCCSTPRTATELVDDAIESGGFIARREVCDLARDLSAALLTSDHPDAGAWSAALVWFANRAKGGQISVLLHREFVDKFGVDPTATATETHTRLHREFVDKHGVDPTAMPTETHMRHTVGVNEPPRALCDADITTGLVAHPADVTCHPCSAATARAMAEQRAFEDEQRAGEDY